MMVRDFSTKIADLLSSCSAVVSALPARPQVSLPDPVEVAANLARASAGDADAQVDMSNYCLAVGQVLEDGPYFENAENWARAAADTGLQRGEYALAGVLLFRAGMLAGTGFIRLARELAMEALDLLNMLADEGFEEAAVAIVTASKALAEAGVVTAPALWEV